jgi:hypothetical protein
MSEVGAIPDVPTPHPERQVLAISGLSQQLRKKGYCEIARAFRAIMRSETLCHVRNKFRHQCPPNADAIVIGNAES